MKSMTKQAIDFAFICGIYIVLKINDSKKENEVNISGLMN